MQIRIYQPAKTAMQSGLAGTLKWVMEFPPDAPRVADPLMGWTSSTDTRAQVQLTFDTKEEAVAFAEKHGLPFTILADADKAVTKRYGVLKTYMGMMDMARRDTFIIDPQGRIAKHYESVKPDGHSAVVLADIKALKAKAASGTAGGR